MKRFYLMIFIGLAFGIGSCGDEKVEVDFPSSNLAIVSWDGLKGKEFLIERSGEEGLSLLARHFSIILCKFFIFYMRGLEYVLEEEMECL